MQRMQRLTGRFLTRTPNEADIEAMLTDFKDAEIMLTKVCLLLLRNLKCNVSCGRCEPVGFRWCTKQPNNQTCTLHMQQSS
jgi:hypothetical protein